MKKTIICLIILVLAACEKDGPAPHPLAGEWRIKNVESKQYLAFTDDKDRPAFDIGNGVSNVMTLLAGPDPGQYYIVPKANIDMYLGTKGAIYTYVLGTTFSDSNEQLFTFEPINEGSDRYYIQSVANPSLYLVSCYSCYGRSSTLSIAIKAGDYWDSIWTLEKQ